jgi:hypothetical protein
MGAGRNLSTCSTHFGNSKEQQDAQLPVKGERGQERRLVREEVISSGQLETRDIRRGRKDRGTPSMLSATEGTARKAKGNR